jgi:4-amino-4-deoxy-L-arabinose transferase-like glycosyltransferase
MQQTVASPASAATPRADLAPGTKRQGPPPARLPASALVVLLAAVYLLPGLIGHQPWKQDETYIADIVRSMLDSGDFLVPVTAGEPFMEKPPLYYWMAALCAWLSSPWLPLHDGARLANPLLLGFTCWLLARTARAWWGRERAWLAPLLLLACPGMFLHAHFLLTDLATLPGMALALHGAAIARNRPAAAGAMIGTGAGIGFLAKGLFVPGVMLLWGLLLWAAYKPARSGAWRSTAGVALLAGMPWLLGWPLFLYLRSPALFADWFWLNNVGRFIGFSVARLGAAHDRFFWFQTLPWFAIPALPLALASCLDPHRRASHAAALMPLAMLIISMLAVLGLAASARNNYALPLLPPLALLAVPAAASIPAPLGRRLDGLARVMAAMLALSVWLLWCKLHFPAAPLPWLLPAQILPHDFNDPVSPLRLGAALLLSGYAAGAGARLRLAASRWLISWTAGLALAWALLSLLLLPWIDAAKSYRAVLGDAVQALPVPQRCLASIAVGESERAMLHYYFGVVSVQVLTPAAAGCDVLLIEQTRRQAVVLPDAASWRIRWQGNRPGDSNERFTLYLREGAAAPRD